MSLMKILLQNIWETGIDWDQLVPDTLASSWNQWRQELPQLLCKTLHRRLYDSGKEVLEIVLNEFANAPICCLWRNSVCVCVIC